MISPDAARDTLPSSQGSGRSYSRPDNIPRSNDQRLPTRHSRTSESRESLTMLSPKTPSQIDINYHMFGNVDEQSNTSQGTMSAFNSYGMGYTGNFETLPNTNPFSTGQNYTSTVFSSEMVTTATFYTSGNVNSARVDTLHTIPSEYVTSTVAKASESRNKMATTHQEQKTRAQKRGRKTTMSLNPEEREALENLIGDVIVGIGEGIIDSEESTSSENDTEEEVKTPTETHPSKIDRLNTSGSELEKLEKNKFDKTVAKDKPKTFSKEVKKDVKPGEPGQKVYPPQLKVAVKHMRNLPPRFLRKIQTNKDDDQMKFGEKPHRIQELPEPPEPPRSVEIMKPLKPEPPPPPLPQRERGKSKEEQKLEKKRKVRGLLDTLDIYFEQSVPGEEKKTEKSADEQIVVIAPVNENPYSSNKMTHSAPASTQVSPSTQRQEPAKNLDILQLDPAIKAQGPPMSNMLPARLNVPPPPMSSSLIYTGMVPESPGVNCEELEREMFEKARLSNVPYSMFSQLPPSVSIGTLAVTAAMPSVTVAPPPQYLHSSPDFSQMSPAHMHIPSSHHGYSMTQAQMKQFGQFMQMNQPVRMPFWQHLQPKSKFSVDAPEFVPRTFTPNISLAQGMPSPVSSNLTPQHTMSTQPFYVVSTTNPSMMTPVVSSHQMTPVTGLTGLPSAAALQGPPPPVAMQIPAEGFTGPPPMPPPPMSVSMGLSRASPQVNNSIAALAKTTMAEQMTTMGRNSAVPGSLHAGHHYIIPKVPPHAVGHPPPPHPGMSAPPPSAMMYAPMYATYSPHGFHTTAAPYAIPAGHFFVPAWSGGRKDKFSSLPLHLYPPATQKHSGTPTKPTRNAAGLHQKGASTMSPKRTQTEMSPEQAKEHIPNLINQGKKVLLLLRGLPGSGKSTLAKEAKGDGVVLSTDDFFLKDGKYEYDYARLSEAHEFNKLQAKEALEKGTNPVIIDNTNTLAFEMRPYVSLALKHQYHVEIMEPNTTWKFKPKELAQKNGHGVPLEKIQEMADRYEYHLTVERVLGMVDRRKVDPEAEVGDGDAEGDENKPRKRRRRRRRRKKKQTEGGGSDSEKDDKSTDEDVPVKPGKVVPQLVQRFRSTDSDNETGSRREAENRRSQNPALAATRSLSLESDEPPLQAPIVEESSASRITAADENTSKDHTSKGISLPETVNVDHEESVTQVKNLSTADNTQLEIITTASDQTVANSHDCENVSEEVQVTEDDANENSGECDEGFQESPHREESVADEGEDSGKTTPGEECTPVVTHTKEDSFDLGLEADCIVASGNDSENSAPSVSEGPAENKQNVENKSTASASGERVEKDSIVKNEFIKFVPDGPMSEQTVAMADNVQFDVTVSKLTDDMNGVDNNGDRLSNNQTDNLLTADSASDKEVAYWSTDSIHTTDPYVVAGVEAIARSEDMAVCQSPVLGENNEPTASVEEPKGQRTPRRREKEPGDTTMTTDETEFWSETVVDKCDVDESAVETVPNDSAIPSTTADNAPTTSRSVSLLEDTGVGREAMPAFHKDVVTPESYMCLNLKNSCEGGERALCSRETFTNSEDLAAVNELLLGPHTEIQSAGINMFVLVATAREICSASENSRNQNSSGVVRGMLKYDKGTMTEGKDVNELNETVSFLCQCFPDGDESYMEHILEQSEGNREMAVDFLLDAGFVFKPTDESQFENSLANSNFDVDEIQICSVVTNENEMAVKTTADVTEIMSSEPSVPSMDIAKTTTTVARSAPTSFPSLLSLCHGVLAGMDILNSEELCEGITYSGVQRMRSIDEFKSSAHSNEPNVEPSRGESLSAIGDPSDVFANFGLTPPQPSDFAQPSLPKQPSQSVASTDESTDATLELPYTLDAEESSDGVAAVDREEGVLSSDDVVLTLPPAAAQQLIELFGPVGFPISADSMSANDLRVRLSRSLAREVHHRWALTLKQKFAFEEAAIDRMMLEDEDLARMLQKEEERRALGESTEVGTLPGSARSPALPTAEGDPPTSLVQIMNEQYEEQAIAESKREFQNRNASSPDRHLATRIKKQELYSAYPLLEQSIIDDILAASGFRIGVARRQIEELYGQKEPVKNAMTAEAHERMKEELLTRAIPDSMQSQWLDEDASGSGGYRQLEGESEYDTLRSEASMYYRLRHEAFQKAQDAYRSSQRGLASWHSQVGHRYSEKLKDVNKRAAEILMENRKTTESPCLIDLHGLHLAEALDVLIREIELRECERRERPGRWRALRQLEVVTGWGKHSTKRAKVRPNVITWLQQHSYTFVELSPGRLLVNLK